MDLQKQEFLKEGHLNDEAAALYVDSLLSKVHPQLPEKVLDHVEECFNCKDKIIDVYTFIKNPNFIDNQLIPLDNGSIFHNENKKTTKWYSTRIAATFLGFCLCLSTYFFVIKKPPKQIISPPKEFHAKSNPAILEKTTNKKTLHKERKTPQKESMVENNVSSHLKQVKPVKVAENFEINPNLETMVDSPSRSLVIRVFSPPNNAKVNKEIHFSWNQPQPKSLILKILNNKNNTIYKYTVTQNAFTFKESLKPGLYYWKLEDKNDLLYVGKFIVQKKQ